MNTIFTVTALYCPDAKKREWMTTDKKAAEFLVAALRQDEDWADTKVVVLEGAET